MDVEFKSLSELYTRIKPALLSKRMEFHRHGIKYIKEEDLWNYLKATKWQRTTNLSLSDMINDIFNCDNDKIDNYVKQQMSKLEREVNLEDE